MFIPILNILFFIFINNINLISITSPTKKYTKTISNLGSIDVIEPFYEEEEKSHVSYFLQVVRQICPTIYIHSY